MIKKMLAFAAAASLAGASLLAAPAAEASTIKACVKKSNGSVKFINKKNKKCKKGWVKTTWNSQGQQGQKGDKGDKGDTGAPGPNWLVKDKNGVTLGTFSGYFNFGLVPVVMVTVDDGGVFAYDVSGTLFNNNSAVYFVNNGCTDAAQWTSSNAVAQPILKSAGSSGRVTFQVTGAPTASAWKVATTTITTVPVAANSLFQRNPTTGTCAAASNATGFIVPLTPATAPIVATPGALQIVK